MMAKKTEERIQSGGRGHYAIGVLGRGGLGTRGRGGARSGGPSASGFSLNKAAAGGEIGGIADMMQLKDTTVSYPEMPELTSAAQDGSGDISQPTHPAASVGEETPSILVMPRTDSSQPVAVWRPLAFFLLVPTGLVVLTALLWLAAKLF